ERCCQRSRQRSRRLPHQAVCVCGTVRASEGSEPQTRHSRLRAPAGRRFDLGSGDACRVSLRPEYRTDPNGVPHSGVHDAQPALRPSAGRYHQCGVGVQGHCREQYARRIHETTSLENRSGPSGQADPHGSRLWLPAVCGTALMKLSIRARLTLRFSGVVAVIILVLGAGIFAGASWGLQQAADLELKTGLGGVSAFIQKKFALPQMDNLSDELQEHSSLLPRGKMLRVRYRNGPVVYEAAAMKQLSLTPPDTERTVRQTVVVNGRPFRTIQRTLVLGPTGILIELAVDQQEYAELMERLIWMLIFSLPAGVL